MKIWTYISFAADHLKYRLQDAALRNEPEEVRQIHQQAELANEAWRSWAIENGGEVIDLGTGHGELRINAEHVHEVAELKEQYEQAIDSSISVGIGTDIVEANQALKHALKSMGQVFIYDPEEMYEDEEDLSKSEELLKTDIKSPEFQSWFSGSHSSMSDDHGQPRVFYRGTAKPEHQMQGRLPVSSYAENPHVASVYAGTPSTFHTTYEKGANVAPVYMNIRNPIEMPWHQVTFYDVLRKLGYGEPNGITHDEALDMLKHLKDRKMGKTKLPAFQYAFKDPDTGEAHPEYSRFSDLIDDFEDNRGHPEEALKNAVGLHADTYSFVDAPQFKKVAERLGHDGVIHHDVLSPHRANDLLGLKPHRDEEHADRMGLDSKMNELSEGYEEDLTHPTVRPFHPESQVIGVHQGLGSKKNLSQGIKYNPLDKAEKLEAGFRNKEDGTIHATGGIHDISELDEPDKWEDGFIDHEGKFHTREEAQKLTKADDEGPGGEPHQSQQGSAGADPGSVRNFYVPLRATVGAPMGPDGTPAQEPDAPGRPSPQDYQQQLGQLADAQGQQDQAQAQEQQQAQEAEGLKQKVLQALQTFQSKKEELEGLKEQDPEMYKAFVTMVQSMIEMARNVFGSEEGEQEQVQKSLPINPRKKKEDKVELAPEEAPKEDDELQKESLKHGSTLGSHKLNLPPGSQIDTGSTGTHHAGKVKVEDPATGDDSWRSVRAGRVLAPDGTPTSSRNPNPK